MTEVAGTLLEENDGRDIELGSPYKKRVGRERYAQACSTRSVDAARKRNSDSCPLGAALTNHMSRRRPWPRRTSRALAEAVSASGNLLNVIRRLHCCWRPPAGSLVFERLDYGQRTIWNR